MRSWVVLLGLAVACGSPPDAAPPVAEPPAPPIAAAPEIPGQALVTTAALLVEVARAPVERGGETGLLLRLTNRGDAPLLADLRSVDRVIGVGPREPRMPLTEAQRRELTLISALVSISPGETVDYAVPVPALAPSCEGDRELTLSGGLVVLDGDRTLELAVDGAEVTLPCGTRPVPFPVGAVWVDQHAPMIAESRPLAAFSEDFPPLVRAAAVDPEADIALLAFSYDPLPIERFRYDACVALERCPLRAIPQPPGSVRAPAVGMTWEGAEAFCATRGLHVASPEERAVIADPSRELVLGDATALALSGFACVRAEPEASPG